MVLGYYEVQLDSIRESGVLWSVGLSTVSLKGDDASLICESVASADEVSLVYYKA